MCGLTAGGLGALIGSPADLSLIRMQASPEGQPANSQLGLPTFPAQSPAQPAAHPCRTSSLCGSEPPQASPLRSPQIPPPPSVQADTTVPLEQRRNYKGVFDALARIVKDEGIGGLFTGAGPTVVRAMALNMGMLASNDQVGWVDGQCTEWTREGGC